MKQHIRLPVQQIALVAFVAIAVHVQAQGTFQWVVTFDGPPFISPISAIPVTNYMEAGMSFTPISPSGTFGRSGGAELQEGFPRNGTPYIFAMFDGTLAVTSLSGAAFGLVSVDLAEFSTLYNYPKTVQFIGYLPDGRTVATEFTTDGTIDGAGPVADFETFQFDERFSNLVRVEVPTHTWSLDNMVFSIVPEPSVNALLLLGGSLLGYRLFKRKK
jgi:hypothetical protein